MSPFPYLSDLNIPQIETDDVMILIGTDNPIAYIPLQVRGGDVNQPYAIRTHLGWIVRGPAHIDTRRNLTNIKFENAEEVLLQKHLRDSGTLILMIQYRATKPVCILKINELSPLWNLQLFHEDGHYKLGLPWRDKNASIPNNLPLAHSRLQNLRKKLIRNPNLHEMY